MCNLLDYLKWRGDLSFKAIALGELDALVLSRLSYLPMEGLAPVDFAAFTPLGNVLEACRARARVTRDERLAYRMKEDDDLIAALLSSPRFLDARLTGLHSRFDPSIEQQFCAVTLLLPDDTAYLVFRGTDGTVVGWKEDFNMCFSDAVPAQTEALAYLQRAAAALRCPLRLGGHSKGGNIAVYAFAFCDAQIRTRVRDVYDHDGPGFNDMVLGRMSLYDDVSRIHTYVPQGSVIGMLQKRDYPYTIIRSESVGILQHDLYKWQIERDRLVRESDLTMTSVMMDTTLTQWLNGMTPKGREAFVDGVFSLLLESGATTLGDLLKAGNARNMVRAYQEMDDDTKQTVKQGLSILSGILKKTAPDTLERAWGKWSARAGTGMQAVVSAVEGLFGVEDEETLPPGDAGVGLPG